jgi:ribose-phosphate pyrophosphokinase
MSEELKVKLFALSSSRELALEVSKQSGIPLSKCSVTRFSDGEINLNIEESVRGHTIYIIQSTCSPVNENLMEVLIMTDALKRASAKSITVIMPYYGYSRQDKKVSPRQPITAKLVADLLERAGVNRIMCFDFHASQIQGFFNIPSDNFLGAPLLASYFLKHFNKSNIIVISPDHGGTTRARYFAKYFGASIAIIDKRRPRPNEVEMLDIIGNVEGKTAIIIDDIIDTAGTVTAAANILLEKGAIDVYVAATHGVFSGDAIKKIEDSPIKKVIVTNTISFNQTSNKIHQVNVGKVLGKAIIRQIHDEPISVLFDDIEGV